MTVRTIFSFFALLFITHVAGQTRNLTGKIVDDNFRPFIQVQIFSGDTVLLGKSDMTGNFSITIPLAIKTLIVAYVGMEWKRLDIADSCSNLEIILLPRWTHDFQALKKVDELRKKQFDRLPALHKTAFEQGVFNSVRPCYVDNFISILKK